MKNSTPVFLAEQIRAIEHWAFHQSPSPPLMERAGMVTAQLARAIASDRTRRILVLAGPGNNGGDSFVAARHLRNWWFDVHVVFTGEADKLKTDAKAAFEAWVGAGGSVHGEVPHGLRWELALDGLFGIGLERGLDTRHSELAATLNASGQPVVAIDIPSGLHADTGRVLGAAVRATHTITFLGRKAGLYTLDGPDHAGEIHLDMLGLEDAPLPAGHGSLIGDDVIENALPPRPRNSHKGLFGDVAIVGGAPGMVGAALLAGRSALKLGAGRVLVGLLAEGPAVDFGQPELMIRSVEELLARKGLGALVVGPGLGQSDTALHALSRAVVIEAPLVLDADALNLIAGSPDLQTALQRRRQPALLTPHPAEAGRLLGAATAEIQQDRVRAARALASKLNAGVVLKGCGSICAFPDGGWHVNTSGNPGMASAGMGDVLAGILGALLAQGASPRLALLAATHVHGLAADEMVLNGTGPVGLTASETIDAARHVWNRSAR